MRKLLLLVLGLIGLLFVVACDKPNPPVTEELKALYLDQTNLTLKIDDTYQLVVTKDPINDTSELTWSSTALNVAEVSQTGLITAKATGETTIRVEASNGISTSMTLTVVEDIEEEVTSLPIDYNFDTKPSGLNIAYSGGGFNTVADGILSMGTIGTGNSQAAIIFDEALKETTVIETRIKVNTVAFTNAIFLYTSGTSVNDIVVALAFENNSIKYHSGSGWTTIMSHQMDTWYDLKMVVNIGSRSLNQTKGDFDLYVNGTLLGNYSFRNGGDGYEDNIYALRFGSDKQNSEFSYDYLKIYYATKPTLTLIENSKTLTLEQNSVDYKVLYAATGNPEISITSTTQTGYTVNDDVITFTAAGTYEFKVRATTGAGYVERTLNIVVEGSIYAPTLNIIESSKSLLFTEGLTYTLLYEVTGGDPLPEVSILVEPHTGVTLSENVATFTELGTYVFSVKAENTVASVTKTITVKVTDTLTFIDETFDTEPTYQETTVGTGTFSYTDNKANFKTGTTSGQVFLNIPLEGIDGSFVISEDVTVLSNSFSNVLFIYANNGIGTTDIALGIAIENGLLRSHNGTAWRLVEGAPNVLNQTINLKLHVNVEAGEFELFIDDVSYGILPFRHPNLKDSMTHLYLGSDKVNANFTLDNIKASYILAPELELDTLEASVNIDENPEFEVIYTVKDFLLPTNVIITGEDKPGYQIEGDIIRFTNVGTFEFVVTASNSIYETSKVIQIQVTGSNFAPIIEVIEQEVTLDFSLVQSYTLNYLVTTGNPEPTVEITSTNTSGFTLNLNEVTFTELGIYEFMVTATNSIGSDQKLITVNVLDDSVQLMESFNHPRDYEFTTTGNGNLSYTNQTLNLTTQIAPNSVFVTIPFKETLTQSFTISQQVTVNTPAFSNVLFIYGNHSNAGTSIAVAIAVQDGILKYHDGSWKNVPGYSAVLNQTLDLMAYVDIDTKMVDLYIDGAFVVSFGFRTPSLANNLTHLYLGSDKQDTNFEIDNLIIKYVDTPELELTQTEITLDIDTTPSHVLTYTTTDPVTITTSALEGVTISGDELTFTMPGTYEFLVTASNGFRNVSKTFTVIATSSYYAPILTVNETEKAIDLSIDNTYELNYVVDANPTAVVDIVVDLSEGFILVDNMFTFTAPGTYTVTITATNNKGSETGIVVLTVSETGYAPTVTLLETAITIDLKDTNEVLLVYSVDAIPSATVAINVDLESGYTLVDQLLTFTIPGTYIVTIEATNTFGTDQKTLTITVLDTRYAPTITVNETDITIDLLFTNTYTLDFEVDALPEATLDILVDQTEGYVLDNQTLQFSLPGTYIVTINAENMKGSTSESITIHVIETPVIDHEYIETFDTLPLEMVHSGSGTSQIVDGVLVLQTGATTGKALYNGSFERALKGTYAVETRVKISAPVFTNLILLYSGTSNVLGVAVQDGTLRYQNGTTWINSEIAVPQDEFFTLKVITTVMSGTFDIYVNDVNYGNYSLRTKGAAEATVTRYASQGIDSRINQTMHVDYFKVYQLSPEIYFEQLQHTVVLTLNNTLELDFEFGKGLETTYHFTADIETGWTALDHILTFTNPGLYTFTLHAQNAFGIQTKTFEVDVQLGDTNPVITLNENEASIDLSSSTNTYELNYSTNVTNPISTLSIDVDQLTGYTLEGNQLSFSQIGIYIVTLSYSNENSTDTKIVTITVTKTEPESYIYIDNFDTLPTTLTLTGDATANIEDGQLVLQTYATSAKAHFGGTFDQALVGTYAAETRVKLTGTSFLNLILLYSGTSNVLGVAVQDGTLRYQNGTAWINSEIAVPQDEFFTLKVITTVMSGTFDIYVNDVNYGNYSLRTKGAAEANVTRYASQGIDSRINQKIVFDYFKVYQVSPELFVAPTNTITLNLDNTLPLEVGQGLPINLSLTANIQTGWTFENNIITFTDEGTYLFTANIENVYGTSIKTFEVHVLLGDTMPVITANEVEATVDLSGVSHDYQLDFTTNITSPASNLMITVNSLDGYQINNTLLSFSKTGVYEITLTYENTNGSDTATVTVTVIKSAFTNTIIHDEFLTTGDLSNYTVTTTGSGQVSITGSAIGAEDGALLLSTSATTGQAFIEMPFNAPLSGIVIAEARIMVGSTSFSNVLFFYTSGTTIVAPLAFDSGLIRYHDGSWKSTGFNYDINTWYTVKMVVDVDSKNYDLYVDNIKIGTYGFRTPASSNDMIRFRNGSDKVNSSIYYDYIALYETE